MKKHKRNVAPPPTLPPEDDRLAVLRDALPQLFTGPRLNILYVGACENRHDLVPELKAAGHTVTVLEIWPAYADWLDAHPELFDQVIRGDVRDVLTLAPGPYDVAMWWHGPEHMVESGLADVFAKLEGVARLVVLGCPWGVFPQEAIDGNPAQAHSSHLLPDFFQALGYKTITTGSVNSWGSGITAWK